MFTLQRLKLPPSLYKCLATTNVIESPQGGVARRTGNVTRWRDQEMVERWVASAWLLTENILERSTVIGICGRSPPSSAVKQQSVVAGEDSVDELPAVVSLQLRLGHPPGCPPGGIVLDPFIGAGTTALVALQKGRRFIGIELNSEYRWH